MSANLMHCVQCVDRLSGETGDFVFERGRPFEAVSPVFGDLGELFKWLAARGLETGPMGTFTVQGIPIPAGFELVAANDRLLPGDHVLWSRHPWDAWTGIVADSPFVGMTPADAGHCFARRTAQ